MEETTRDMRASIPVVEAFKTLLHGKNRRNKIGRNELCPCGSGRKYKKCCRR